MVTVIVTVVRGGGIDGGSADGIMVVMVMEP